ncbi:UNVERIFIED_CONTAM: hypothetical protein GTU68_006697, partial [Idotea baltica]|nr:hypothetical protein [Idotea baltica]
RNSNVDGPALCSLALASQGCGPFKGPSWSVHIPPHTNYLRRTPQISLQLSPPVLAPSIPTSYEKRHRSFYGEERSIDFSEPTSQLITPYQEDNPSYKKVLKVLHLTDP